MHSSYLFRLSCPFPFFVLGIRVFFKNILIQVNKLKVFDLLACELATGETPLEDDMSVESIRNTPGSIL